MKQQASAIICRDDEAAVVKSESESATIGSESESAAMRSESESEKYTSMVAEKATFRSAPDFRHHNGNTDKQADFTDF